MVPRNSHTLQIVTYIWCLLRNTMLLERILFLYIVLGVSLRAMASHCSSEWLMRSFSSSQLFVDNAGVRVCYKFEHYMLGRISLSGPDTSETTLFDIDGLVRYWWPPFRGRKHGARKNDTTSVQTLRSSSRWLFFGDVRPDSPDLYEWVLYPVPGT